MDESQKKIWGWLLKGSEYNVTSSSRLAPLPIHEEMEMPFLSETKTGKLYGNEFFTLILDSLDNHLSLIVQHPWLVIYRCEHHDNLMNNLDFIKDNV